jgi:hypothetical protein
VLAATNAASALHLTISGFVLRRCPPTRRRLNPELEIPFDRTESLLVTKTRPATYNVDEARVLELSVCLPPLEKSLPVLPGPL